MAANPMCACGCGSDNGNCGRFVAQPVTWSPDYKSNRDHLFGVLRIVHEACCHRCVKEANAIFPFMLVCALCGNKRCPKAEDHRFACTNSNEPGQVGHVGEDAVIPPRVEYRTVPTATLAALEAVARAAGEALEAWGSGTFDAESAAMETLMYEIEALKEARRG